MPAQRLSDKLQSQKEKACESKGGSRLTDNLARDEQCSCKDSAGHLATMALRFCKLAEEEQKIYGREWETNHSFPSGSHPLGLQKVIASP